MGLERTVAMLIIECDPVVKVYVARIWFCRKDLNDPPASAGGIESHPRQWVVRSDPFYDPLVRKDGQ
jgi:hypothetical protein